MFSKPVDNELKKKVYSNLQTNTEINIISLKERVQTDIKSGKFEELKDLMRIIKKMIKDKMSAKPKFYALLLLNEIMNSKKTVITEYFIKKLMDRLFKIAQFEFRSTDPNKGQRCLDEYYNQGSKDNKEYSQKFYFLLLECWKHWDETFSSSFKKIREKADKLRPIFPNRTLYLNQLENLQESTRFEQDNAAASFHENSDLGTFTQPTGARSPDHFLAAPPKEVAMPPALALATQNKVTQAPQTQPLPVTVPELNKSELTALIRQSRNGRISTKEVIANMDEATFQEMFNDFYNTQNDIKKKLQTQTAAVSLLRGKDDKLYNEFHEELDYSIDFINKMDDFSRKAVDYPTFIESLKTDNQKEAAPAVKQSHTTDFNQGIEDEKQLRVEGEFGGSTNMRRSEGGFGIETFGNRNQPIDSKGGSGLIGSFGASGFVKPVTDIHEKDDDFEHGNYEPEEDQNQGDFAWNISSKKDFTKNSEPNEMFGQFDGLANGPFRNAQSVSAKAFSGDNRPIGTLTARNQQKNIDFSPSVARTSNNESKDNDFGTAKSPFGAAFKAKEPESAAPKKFNFGKQSTPEQDFINASAPQPFKNNIDNNPFGDNQTDFGFKDAQHTNFEANLEQHRRESDHVDAMKGPKFSGFGQKVHPFGSSNSPFEQKFVSQKGQESNKSLPMPSFEEKKFGKKSPFANQQSNDSDPNEDQLFSNDPKIAVKDYRNQPEEDAEEEHHFDDQNEPFAQPSGFQPNRQQPTKFEFESQDLYDFDLKNDSKLRPKNQPHNEYQVEQNFKFNFVPNKVFTELRKSQRDWTAPLNESRKSQRDWTVPVEEKGTLSKELGSDAGGSFKHRQTAKFGDETEELGSKSESLKRVDKNQPTTMSFGANRPGFTFGGADIKRSKFDDTDHETKERVDNTDADPYKYPLKINELEGQAERETPRTQKSIQVKDSQIEELKNENEFLKQQCKLLHDQWTEVTQNSAKPAVKMTESQVKTKALYPSSVVETEPDGNPRRRNKQQKQIELFTKLNEQYSLYIETLKKDLGWLIRN